MGSARDKVRYQDDPDFRAQVLKKNSDWYQRKRDENPAAYLISRARRRQECTLEESDIDVPSHCPCCDTEMAFGEPKETSPTLDRIDNKRPYSKGNVVVVCFRCNRAKGDLQIPELLRLANFYSSLLTKGTENGS